MRGLSRAWAATWSESAPTRTNGACTFERCTHTRFRSRIECHTSAMQQAEHYTLGCALPHASCQIQTSPRFRVGLSCYLLPKIVHAKKVPLKLLGVPRQSGKLPLQSSVVILVRSTAREADRSSAHFHLFTTKIGHH
eukprot:1104014-Rhodomonas_salina.1